MNDDTRPMGGPEFDDPSRLDTSSKPTSLSGKIIGISLIFCMLNFISYLWDEKWADKGLLEAQGTRAEKIVDPRWGWEPFKLEYQLYSERGYDLDWLEGKTARDAREFLGEYSPFFEMFALRVFGLFQYSSYIVISFLFFLSLGSVRYHDKKFEFKHISSTFNNAAIRVLFLSMALGLVWCSLPFGMALPVVDSLIPVLADFPFLGVVWLSSPAIGATVFGSIYSIVAFVLGANFSRDI